ncbi:MAG: [NiFe]-hydrogenase assembly chaperone HybE [Alphaproteobacteria bacterium]
MDMSALVTTPPTPTPEEMTVRLESCFREIETTRMAGIPILNNTLTVRALGMQKMQDHWFCILLTPWSMNAMLLPVAGEAAATLATGDKRIFPFPQGQFEFIHGFEPAIGSYWMCSLFSPVFEFDSQETAEATALAARDEMLTKPGNEQSVKDEDSDMAMIWRGELPAADAAQPERLANDAQRPVRARQLSRRAFLTGSAKGEEA